MDRALSRESSASRECAPKSFSRECTFRSQDAPEPLTVHPVPANQSTIEFLKRLEGRLANCEEFCHTVEATNERKNEQVHEQLHILDVATQANATQIQDLKAMLLLEQTQWHTMQRQIKELEMSQPLPPQRPSPAKLIADSPVPKENPIEHRLADVERRILAYEGMAIRVCDLERRILDDKGKSKALEGIANLHAEFDVRVGNLEKAHRELKMQQEHTALENATDDSQIELQMCSSGAKDEPLQAHRELEMQQEHTAVENASDVSQAKIQMSSSGPKDEPLQDAELDVQQQPRNSTSFRLFSNNTDYFKIGPTVWELPILIGLIDGWRHSAAEILVACLLNVVVQVLFIAIVAVSFATFEEHDLDLDHWATWRHTLAHDAANVNPVTGESLASRACREDKMLEDNFFATLTLSDIRPYMAESFLFFPRIGSCLCCLVSLIWILQGSKDLNNAVSYMTGVISMPVSTRSVLIMSWEGDHLFAELVSLSLDRRRCACALTLVRMTISVFVTTIGSLWLAKTANVEELVLNSIALAFILDLDELFFDTLIPPNIQAVVPEVNIIGMSERSHPPVSLRCWGYILHFISLCFLLYVTLMHVNPFIQDLHALEQTMCDGNLHFAVGLNEPTKLLYVAPTSIVGETLWPDGKPKEVDFVESLAQRSSLAGVTDAVLMPDFASMSSRYSVELEIFVEERFSSCADRLSSAPAFVLAALQRYNSNSSAKTCEGLKDRCFELNQHYLRLNCPVTCGAASPLSGQLLDYEAYGVNKQMCRETDLYRLALAKIPCKDSSHEQLNFLPGWNQTWKQFVAAWGRFSKTQQRCYQDVSNIFMVEGCAAFSKDASSFSCMEFAVDSFCSSRTDIPRVALFCPVACGCQTNYTEACPPACNN